MKSQGDGRDGGGGLAGGSSAMRLGGEVHTGWRSRRVAATLGYTPPTPSPGPGHLPCSPGGTCRQRGSMKSVVTC